ncbi:DUF3301 domain-containing protein [Alteromonas sp. C1M14]|uniref:DUF3301 domain-containing protein n=1 Tax=Alteromonas sp. C1M14 TaxID=2841567 RepID=UPI001C08E1B4|nr:DUF3301 domain-containing protein [Alteromonas sp. C1M14]MBU2977855.1 DUF3301 domain-containing protein [Alteromonas sp. C1M14]
MTLLELTLFLFLGFVGFQFWRIRSISEAANQYILQYCHTHQLQLLTLARTSTRITFKYAKPDWQSHFIFEFSGNGEDRYTGELKMVGKRVVRTQLPPYRV